MELFKKNFLKKSKEKRKEILAKLVAYRDEYLPTKLYGHTKEGKKMNNIITVAEANQNT